MWLANNINIPNKYQALHFQSPDGVNVTPSGD